MTAASIDDQAIVVNSFSKYFSMTGWRLGWLVVPADLVQPIERLQQNLFISPPTLSQHAGVAAFDVLHRLMVDKNAEFTAPQFEAELIVRQSTGPRRK